MLALRCFVADFSHFLGEFTDRLEAEHEVAVAQYGALKVNTREDEVLHMWPATCIFLRVDCRGDKMQNCFLMATLLCPTAIPA